MGVHEGNVDGSRPAVNQDRRRRGRIQQSVEDERYAQCLPEKTIRPDREGLALSGVGRPHWAVARGAARGREQGWSARGKVPIKLNKY